MLLPAPPRFRSNAARMWRRWYCEEAPYAPLSVVVPISEQPLLLRVFATPLPPIAAVGPVVVVGILCCPLPLPLEPPYCTVFAGPIAPRIPEAFPPRRRRW
eukprot:9671177-Lingulodinium_polyedra.AAC.1